MVSAVSGSPVTGISASISGRRSLDGGAQAVVTGPINEVGGGQYNLGMFAADVNGANCGYLFTSSGCVLVSYTVVTTANVSGNLYINSGQNVNVFSGQLSGQQVNLLSGNQTQVWSGTFINVFSGQLSGQPISLLSGQQVLVSSGQLSGQQVNLLSGNQVQLWSGTFVNLFSGQNVNVFSGQLSGQPISLLSGLSYVASGTNTVSPLASGVMSGQPMTLLSGLSYVASGISTVSPIASGQLSGQQVGIVSGTLGYLVNDVFTRNVSGDATTASLFSLASVVCKLTSKFDAKSGITFRPDGTTIHMTQPPVTDNTMVPIRTLGKAQ